MKKQQDMTDSLIETIQISDEEHQKTLDTIAILEELISKDNQQNQ